MRRWPDDIETLLEYRSAVRDAGGSRTHWRAVLQAAALPSGSSVTSVLARNRTWTSTFAGLHAHPAHPEDVNLVAARRGVEPRLAVSRTAVRSGTLAGCVNQYPDLDLNQGLDLRRVQCKSATPSGHEHEREESNPVMQFWRLPALPGAHSCNAALYRAVRVSEGSRTLTSWFTARHAATATPQTP